MNILRFSPYKCIRNQTWPCHKVGQGQPRFIICANLVGPTSPMLHTKSQSQWPFGSREEDINSFYHIWAWWPSQSCDHNNLYKFWLINHKELSHEIWFQLAKWFVRKLCFNMLMGRQYERPWLKGQMSTLTFETLDWTYQVRIITLASTVL